MASFSFASESPNELALLREQIKLLTERLDLLESNAKKSTQTTISSAESEEKQQPKIKILTLGLLSCKKTFWSVLKPPLFW